MRRKLLVQGLAALAVLLLASAAVAANGTFAEDVGDDDPLLEATEEPGEPADVPFGQLRSAEVRAFGACMEEAAGDPDLEEACQELRPGPAHEHPAHPANREGGDDEGDEGEEEEDGEGEGEEDGEDEGEEDGEDEGEEEDGDETDEDSFGALRSAEVRRFGECMTEASGDHEAKARCFAEFHPRPAVEHPAHPVHGDGGGEDGDDEGEDGEESEATVEVAPADPGPPAHAGPPAQAGPKGNGGPPEHAGPPAHAGPRGRAGR